MPKNTGDNRRIMKINCMKTKERFTMARCEIPCYLARPRSTTSSSVHTLSLAVVGWLGGKGGASGVQGRSVVVGSFIHGSGSVWIKNSAATRIERKQQVQTMAQKTKILVSAISVGIIESVRSTPRFFITIVERVVGAHGARQITRNIKKIINKRNIN